jgi:hypothetical protein
MKKYIIIPILIPILVLSSFSSFAQNNVSNSILIRHDTTLLKAEECEWIIKSLVKNDPKLTHELGKSLPMFLLGAIAKGKIKAYDGNDNTLIPAKKIFTWKMRADSVMTYDEQGNNSKIVVMQQEQTGEYLNRIRINQDWYLDIATGKFRSEIKWIELMQEIHTSTGEMLGYAPLCRIYY